MTLPDAFIAEMKALFEAAGWIGQWPAFEAALNQEPVAALRANRLKIDLPVLRQWLAESWELPLADLPPVPWTADGLYIPHGLSPGRLPLYAAGLYYIQEPSAMLPASALGVGPGEWVLDLCAAPGGKTARLTSDLGDSGLLWANEPSPKRVQALLRNVSLTGSSRTVITCASSSQLARQLPHAFDAVLADVPCSGSGMFRSDPRAIRSWLAHPPQSYIRLQESILEDGWAMLRPGGRLVYSTCSFSVLENEGQITRFLTTHPDAHLLDITKGRGVDPGLAGGPQLEKTARIWPHRTRGEGHFCALLLKAPGPRKALPLLTEDALDEKAWEAFAAFCRQDLTPAGQSRVQAFMQAGIRRQWAGQLHLVPPCPAALKAFKQLKSGLYLGRVRDHGRHWRFDPSQAFLLALNQEAFSKKWLLAAQDGRVDRYLRGETLAVADPDWQEAWQPSDRLALHIRHEDQAWPLGWTQVLSPGLLKNTYPRGWVRL